MYKNIEELIESGYKILIEKVRYGTGYYIVFESDGAMYNPFTELLEGIRGFDDIAVEYMHSLEQIESKYPNYPVARVESLEQGMIKTNEKAERWLKNHSIYEQDDISKDIEVMVKELSERWK